MYKYKIYYNIVLWVGRSLPTVDNVSTIVTKQTMAHESE